MILLNLFFSGLINSQITNANVSYGRVEIYDCEFLQLESSNGGAVCLSNCGATNVFVEQSVFHKCKATGNGGSLYLVSDSSNYSFLKVCISESLASIGAVMYSSTSNSELYYHSYDQISITKSCPVSVSGYKYSLNTYYGQNIMRRSNFSNSISLHALCAIFYTANLNHLFNNLESNPTDIIIGVVSSPIKFPIFKCNFVKNIHGATNPYGIIHNNGCSPYLNASDCVFINNTIRTIDEYSGKVYFFNCLLDTFSCNGSPVLINCITNTYATTYNNEFYSTNYCINGNYRFQTNSIVRKSILMICTFPIFSILKT